jgi:hypothetical protein
VSTAAHEQPVEPDETGAVENLPTPEADHGPVLVPPLTTTPPTRSHVGGSRLGLPAALSIGQTYVWGHDRDTARALLTAADVVGVPRASVRFNGAGFIVPDAVFDAYAAADTTEKF